MTFLYNGTLFDLFFSSYTIVDLVLRLCIALFCFFCIGHLICSKQKNIPSADRMMLGIGLAFVATYFYSLFAWKLSLPHYALNVFYVFLLIFGLQKIRAHNHSLSWEKAYWGLLGILLLGTFAEIPRFTYFSEDLPQYAHFIHVHIQKAMVPQDLLPVGPEALNYPSGIGVMGLLFSKYALGLKSLEIVFLLASIVMSVAYLGIYQHERSKAKALFIILSLSLLCWGHIMPNRLFNGYGRAIVLPMLFYLAWRVFYKNSSRNTDLWLTSLWGIIILAVNPAIAPVSFLLILAIFTKADLWKNIRTKKLFFVTSLVGIGLLFFVDPYFRNIFSGEGVPAPNMKSSGYEISVGNALRSLFVLPFTDFWKFWRGLLHLQNTSLIFWLSLAVFLTSKNKKVGPFFSVGAFILSVYFVGEVFLIPDSSTLSLLKTYTRLTMAHVLLLYLLAVLGANLYHLLKNKKQLRRLTFTVFLLVGLFGFTSKAMWRRSSPEKSIEVALSQYAALGEQAPVIALDNRRRTETGENWIIPRKDSWLIGLLDNSKPAFFYWRGRSADFDWKDFRTRICKQIDYDWLAAREITHIFVAPHSTCKSLPKIDEYRIFSLKELAR